MVDYSKVAAAYAGIFQAAGGNIKLETKVLSARQVKGQRLVETTSGTIAAGLIINCAGLHADMVAAKAGTNPGLRIIPFRGEYFELRSERRYLVKGLVYPVPNPQLPFLDVHLTPTVDGSVLAGPNAILASKREGYSRKDFDVGDLASTLSYRGFWWLVGRYWKPGLAEINRSLRKSVFVTSLQRLVPEITMPRISCPVVPASGHRRWTKRAADRRLPHRRIARRDPRIECASPAATSSSDDRKFIAEKADLRINVD